MNDSQQQASTPSAEALLRAIDEAANTMSLVNNSGTMQLGAQWLKNRAREIDAAAIAATPPKQADPQHGGLVPQGGGAGGVTIADKQRACDLAEEAYDKCGDDSHGGCMYAAVSAALEFFAASRLDAATHTMTACGDAGEAFNAWYANQAHQLSNENLCRLIWLRGWQAALAASPSHGTGAV